MSFLAPKGMSLSSTTKEAWRNQGAIFPAAHRDNLGMLELARSCECEFVLNLGGTVFSHNEPYFAWNSAENIAPLRTPWNTRRLYPDLLPPMFDGRSGQAWLKGPGSGGNNKTLRYIPSDYEVPRGWDIQENIDPAAEYRLITVNNIVVQSFRRRGDNTDRNYEWVGVMNSPASVISKAKRAAERLEGTNVIGWDILHVRNEDETWLLEGNSCPGVNDYTAQRIVTKIRELKGEL